MEQRGEATKEPTTADTDAGTEIQRGDQPVRQKWYQWFSPNDTLEERRLILKLDGLIMVFVFLAYWAKVLDQSATSAAYVSGMKEDLGLYGNELNYLNTTYMVGFIVFQIPLTILVSGSTRLILLGNKTQLGQHMCVDDSLLGKLLHPSRRSDLGHPHPGTVQSHQRSPAICHTLLYRRSR